MRSEDAKAGPNHPSNPEAVGSAFGERLAAIEAKMAFVATREDIALLRKEFANREASMQRWLLGITSTALASVVIVLWRTSA